MVRAKRASALGCGMLVCRARHLWRPRNLISGRTHVQAVGQAFLSQMQQQPSCDFLRCCPAKKQRCEGASWVACISCNLMSPVLAIKFQAQCKQLVGGTAENG